MLEVMLRADQWADAPPGCPRCADGMQQELKPVAIGGSNAGRAAALAEQIARDDYKVADMQMSRGIGSTPKVRYQDETSQTAPSVFTSANREMLESVVATGRASRLKHGSGLDVLEHGLKSGNIPDLIEISKRRSLKVW